MVETRNTVIKVKTYLEPIHKFMTWHIKITYKFNRLPNPSYNNFSVGYQGPLKLIKLVNFNKYIQY